MTITVNTGKVCILLVNAQLNTHFLPQMVTVVTDGGQGAVV